MEYTRERRQAKMPSALKSSEMYILGHQFIVGLDDKGKVDLVQVYLGDNKSTVSYANARQAVEKAYQRFFRRTKSF